MKYPPAVNVKVKSCHGFRDSFFALYAFRLGGTYRACLGRHIAPEGNIAFAKQIYRFAIRQTLSIRILVSLFDSQQIIGRYPEIIADGLYIPDIRLAFVTLYIG